MNVTWKNFLIDFFTTVFVAVFLTVCAWLLLGCSPKYITVPEYHYERYHTIDTITKTDSVTKEKVTVIREADSTMLAELGIRLQNGERAILVLRKELERALSQKQEIKHDTIVKCDSIYVPYPVEKQLSQWDSMKVKAGGFAFAVLGLLIIWLVIVLLRKRGVIFRRPRDAL